MQSSNIKWNNCYTYDRVHDNYAELRFTFQEYFRVHLYACRKFNEAKSSCYLFMNRKLYAKKKKSTATTTTTAVNWSKCWKMYKRSLVTIGGPFYIYNWHTHYSLRKLQIKIPIASNNRDVWSIHFENWMHLIESNFLEKVAVNCFSIFQIHQFEAPKIRLM